MARDENMIAALKRERATYVAAGDEDRVRQVDESLAHYGYEGDGASEQDGPQGRTSTPKQTATRGKGRGAAKKTAAPSEKPNEPSPEDTPATTPPAE